MRHPQYLNSAATSPASESPGIGSTKSASALVKGETMLAVRERLLGHLARVLPPAARARDLMIAPVFTLPADTPVARAKEKLLARAEARTLGERSRSAPRPSGRDGARARRGARERGPRPAPALASKRGGRR